MKGKALFILIFMVCQGVCAQQQGSVEQYYYMQEREALTVIPMAHYQSPKNWYVEARYNYEELKTFSLYAGKAFSKESKLSYTIIPMVGGVMGRFKGGSFGLNLDIDYERLFLSSQSQYTFSVEDRAANFLYSWSELGYNIWSWLFIGVAIQHTRLYNTKFALGEAGIVVGFSIGKWEFPVYSFSPMCSNRYFILGINRKFE